MPVPGLLLTGGRSSRMGTAKATLAGRRRAARRPRRRGSCWRAVRPGASRSGPGYSALAAVDEDPPGRGPLAALVAGRRRRGRHRGPVLLLACDLPFVTRELLRAAAWHAPGAGTVVPVDRDGIVPARLRPVLGATRSTGRREPARRRGAVAPLACCDGTGRDPARRTSTAARSSTSTRPTTPRDGGSGAPVASTHDHRVDPSSRDAGTRAARSRTAGSSSGPTGSSPRSRWRSGSHGAGQRAPSRSP